MILSKAGVSNLDVIVVSPSKLMNFTLMFNSDNVFIRHSSNAIVVSSKLPWSQKCRWIGKLTFFSLIGVRMKAKTFVIGTNESVLF